jgi:hypothetical protein
MRASDELIHTLMNNSTIMNAFYSTQGRLDELGYATALSDRAFCQHLEVNYEHHKTKRIMSTAM